VKTYCFPPNHFDVETERKAFGLFSIRIKKGENEKTREGARSGVTRLDRMKRGSGIKGRDDRSSGIEIHIAETLPKINPTDPLILANQAARRNLNCSDSSGISLVRAEASRWACRNSRRLKSSVDTAGRVYCNGHESEGRL
jgi:hypothetical protein